MIDFDYTTVSAEPYFRVANIKVTDILLNKDGVGEFEFEDKGRMDDHQGR